MYAFYADESGFSKAKKFEVNQPILVTAGILINTVKLRKALEVFTKILEEVNSKVSMPVSELKFSEIRNKKPYRNDMPNVAQRADFLEGVVKRFKSEINFKIMYCAIDNKQFFIDRSKNEFLRKKLKHPYLAATYKMLSQLDQFQRKKKRNKGKTFVILDEQNAYQGLIEELIVHPIHCESFQEIFDTAYFGKSHYSKIIQIADLFSGMFRYYLMRLHQGFQPDNDYWTYRLDGMISFLRQDITRQNCFGRELNTIYQNFELTV